MSRLGLQVHTARASQKRHPCDALATIAKGVAEVPVEGRELPRARDARERSVAEPNRR